MSLKIIHVSDIHIRNLKYHDEYRKVFEDLYELIKREKPDLVINTGDTAHTKTQISPEFVEMASEHMRRVAELVPYHMILGNHDLNLMNPDRQDAISPIVDSIGNKNVKLYKKSGLGFSIEKEGTKYNFWVFSLADTENYPLRSEWDKLSGEVNIGLFHGSVTHCVTDSNWRMTHVEHDLSIFDGLDFALLGDIHKQQFFNENKIAYAGSLIQQNFGEETSKGCLIWELGAKGKYHNVKSVILSGSRPFYTLRLSANNTIPDIQLREDSRIRISPSKPLTLVEQKEIEKEVRKKFKPHDIITLSSANFGEQRIVVDKKMSEIENLRQISIQEKLIREALQKEEISESVMSKILELNKKHQISIDQFDTGARNIKWKINKIGWNNLFNYGEGNIIDFSKIPGLTGLFAPNAAGKSNLIDVILETCFDSTTKGINKNIFLVNDNKESATSIAEITANEQNYEIERQIEKIKYGTKSSDKIREWGKTTVNFSLVDEVGGKDQLVGTLRPETEANIRQRLGTFDDFMLTSLLAQWNPMDIISAKETKRKEIIFRFLDLDIFGEKCSMAKDESRELTKKLSELESNEIESVVKKLRAVVAARNDAIIEKREDIEGFEERINELESKVLAEETRKVKVEVVSDQKWDVLLENSEKIKSELSEKHDELEKSLKKLESDLVKFRKLEAKFDQKLFSEKDEEFKKAKEEKKNSEAALRFLNITIQNLSKNASLLKDVPCKESFPSCQFLKNAFESKQKLSGLEEEKEKLDLDISNWNLKIEELEKFSKKLEDFKNFMNQKSKMESNVENLKLQISLSKVSISNIEDKIHRLLKQKEEYFNMLDSIKLNEEVTKTVKLLRSERAEIQNKLSTTRNDLEELVKRYGSEQGRLDIFEKQLSELSNIREMCTAYEHYIRIMGKDGIPHQILTQKLPLINEEINKILSNVADFGVFLEHDSEEQSIRFFIQYGSYKSRLLELGSGAEKFLASIAIRNALLNISVLPKTNMLLIDEGFGKLDPKNLESIQRMFDYLKTVFDHIIIISHLDNMKDMVDNIIDITTDEEGYAHVEVGG